MSEYDTDTESPSFVDVLDGVGLAVTPHEEDDDVELYVDGQTINLTRAATQRLVELMSEALAAPFPSVSSL